MYEYGFSWLNVTNEISPIWWQQFKLKVVYACEYCLYCLPCPETVVAKAKNEHHLSKWKSFLQFIDGFSVHIRITFDLTLATRPVNKEEKRISRYHINIQSKDMIKLLTIQSRQIFEYYGTFEIIYIHSISSISKYMLHYLLSSYNSSSQTLWKLF